MLISPPLLEKPPSTLLLRVAKSLSWNCCWWLVPRPTPPRAMERPRCTSQQARATSVWCWLLCGPVRMSLRLPRRISLVCLVARPQPCWQLSMVTHILSRCWTTLPTHRGPPPSPRSMRPHRLLLRPATALPAPPPLLPAQAPALPLVLATAPP